MLSIAWIQSVDYYLDQAQPDYYFQGGEPQGIWWGQGAEDLGLTGVVTPQALKQLFLGYSPAGEPLVQNPGAEDRQAAWDFTFSAPKSVSVLWSQVDALARRRIQELHVAAVMEALQYVQDAAAFTRRGKGGSRLEIARLIAALFEHGTSREFDPLLHTHCLVINAATRIDGTTGSILSRPLYEHKMAAGAIYRAALAALLQEEFGLRIERDGTSFRIVGVPVDLCREQSKRRQQVIAALQSSGHHSAKAAAIATLDTRRAKDIHPPRAELFPIWQKTNEEFGFSAAAANELYGQAAPIDLELELAAALQIAVDGLLEKQSHFSEQELVRDTAIAVQGRGVSAHRVLKAVRALLAEEVEIVPLGRRGRELRYTSREMFELEVDMLKEVESTTTNSDHVLSAVHVDGILKKMLPISAHHSGDEFLRNSEQRQAVENLTLTPGQIKPLKGVAGAGKTYALGVCREAWERAGFRVTGMALAGAAARNLQQGAGIDSDTLAMRLIQLQVNSPKFSLTPQTIVVLDEAGMVATRQMAMLIRHVLKAGAKLVLVGDDMQLQPIEAGGPFSAIAKRVGRFELTHNVRQSLDPNDQTPHWARDAVQHFAKGNALKGLQLYAERERLFVAENREQAILRLVEDWSDQGISEPAEHVILAAHNADVNRLNTLCQKARFASTGATVKSIQLDSHELKQGDQVLFTRKSRLLGIENGDRGVITSMDVRRQTIAVEVHGQKRRVFVPLKEYPHLKLGYAMTIHKAQGATFQSAYVLAAGRMQDLHLAYVQSSRAKNSTRFYVDRFEAGDGLADLAKQMSRSRQKDLAHDVLEASTDDKVEPPAGDTDPVSQAQQPRVESQRAEAGKRKRKRGPPTADAGRDSPVVKMPKSRTKRGGIVQPTLSAEDEKLASPAPQSNDELGWLKIETTTDPKYLQAAIDRYGVLPGGIVVEGEASCSVPIHSVQIDPREPANIILNESHAFATGLSPDEVVCLWHAVCETVESDNFGALSQSSVVGIEPDTSVAYALMHADDYLGQIAYGYDRHFAVAPTRLAGAVNPFVAEAAAVRSRLDDHATRMAENFLDDVHPQVFVCFSGVAFELGVDRVARTAAGKVTIAIATKQGNKQILDGATLAKRRCPFHFASIARLGVDFKEYVRLEKTLARCVAYASVVQLLRLAKRRNAALAQHETIRSLYLRRKRVAPPNLYYTSRSVEFALLSQETARAIAVQLDAGGRSQKLARYGNVVGFLYSQRAGDASLVAKFKSELERLSTKDELHRYFADQIRSPTQWCHDLLIPNCLAGANRYDASPADEARYRTAALDLCRPALQDPLADDATTCCYLQEMCRKTPSYDPNPELRKLLSAAKFGGRRINLLPFATLTKIIRERAVTSLITRDKKQLAAGIKRLEYELDAEYLSGHALECYRFLVQHLKLGEHFRVLERFKRRKWTLDDIGPIVDRASPQTFSELMALLSVKKTWSQDATEFNAAYLHDANPFLLSYPLLNELSSGQQNDLLAWLEHEAHADAIMRASKWWPSLKLSMPVGGLILLLEELIVRGKKLDDLHSVMDQQNIDHPQAALFWLDFQDLRTTVVLNRNV